MSARERITDTFEDALFLEPAETFDIAILGVAERAGGMVAVPYDRGLCIDGLMIGGMTRGEAEEYFDFNTVGAWVGENTPVFLDRSCIE